MILPKDEGEIQFVVLVSFCSAATCRWVDSFLLRLLQEMQQSIRMMASEQRCCSLGRNWLQCLKRKHQRLNCPLFTQDQTCGPSLAIKRHPVHVWPKGMKRRHTPLFPPSFLRLKLFAAAVLVIMTTCPKTPLQEVGLGLTADQYSGGLQHAAASLTRAFHK